MKSNLFIPKKIHVGFQKRSDTFIGNLAYVIYEDEKGKLRKETSWNSWRDKNIEVKDLTTIKNSYKIREQVKDLIQHH